MTVVPECPACRQRMEEGFVGDAGHHGVLLKMMWREGRAKEKALSGLETKGRRAHQLVAYRCARCGWVIWFAPDRGETK